MSTFLACPAKYHWTYIHPKGRWYLRSKSYYSFGTSLHNVLQRFHDSADTGVTDITGLEAAFEESWIDAGYASAEEAAEAFAEGKEILSKYVEEYAAREDKGETIMVEKTVRADMGEFVLLGRIDRVDRLKDGTLEIIDYKSGRSRVSEDDLRGELGLACYQIIMRRLHPLDRVVGTIIALRTGAHASIELSYDELAEAEATVREIGSTILQTNWDEVRPAFKPICAGCDFIQLCREDPDFKADESAANASVDATIEA